MEGNSAIPNAKKRPPTAVLDSVRSNARKPRTTPIVIIPRNCMSVAVQSVRYAGFARGEKGPRCQALIWEIYLERLVDALCDHVRRLLEDPHKLIRRGVQI
jgi:hypothetical protein